jgi:AcrR family transcriptional regulator
MSADADASRSRYLEMVDRVGIEDFARKERLLAVADQLALEDPLGEPAYGHLAGKVTLAEVASRIGCSRPTLYKRWLTQHDFRTELAARLVVPPDHWQHDSMRSLAAQLDDDHPDLFEACRRWSNEPVPPRLATRLRLRGAVTGFPLPVELARRRCEHERRDRALAASALEDLLRRVGRRPVGSLTVADLETNIAVLVDSATMIEQLLGPLPPLVVDGDEGRAWSILGYGVRCLFTELTEPIPRGASSATSSAERTLEAPVEERSRQAESSLREQALRTGEAVFFERMEAGQIDDDPAALSHVTIDRLAHRAGISRRRLYDIWPSQKDLRLDVVRHQIVHASTAYVGDLDTAVRYLFVERPEPPSPTLAALAVCEAINRHRNVGTTPLYPQFSLLAELNDPMLGELHRAAVLRSSKRQAELLQALVDLLDVTLRPGVGVAAVNRLLVMAAGGSNRLHAIDPDAIRTDVPHHGGTWSTFSIACSAIVAHSVHTTGSTAS